MAQLKRLCDELRAYIPAVTHDKPAHISASLAVTELTVALHVLLDTPNDILIWDVGHQAYVHKVLTGRREAFANNRKFGGPSGFPMRQESAYDAFGTGHSSTSISALGGMYTAAKLLGKKQHFVAVIGDGALTGGQAFEALNHLGALGADIMVVLNDNSSSIDPNVGALHEKKTYQPFFEALQFHYSGPIAGNNLEELVAQLRKSLQLKGPRVVHITTEKQPVSIAKKATTALSLQEVFGHTLVELGKKDTRITGITPAMLSGCSLDIFASVFPERTFDTGITEQHAVTFAAGQAAMGLRPYVNLYATFAQRAYDQIIHDVALQQLPVVFCIERAGLVGEDGPTHHGAFDISFLSAIPNLQLFAPQNGAELRAVMHQSSETTRPVAIRYPKTKSEPIDWQSPPRIQPYLRQLHAGEATLVLSTGFISNALQEVIVRHSLPIAHYHLTQLKPLPKEALLQLASGYERVITFEENSVYGGFGAAIAQLLSQCDIRVKTIGLPDAFVPHGDMDTLLAQVGLAPTDLLQHLLAAW